MNLVSLRLGTQESVVLPVDQVGADPDAPGRLAILGVHGLVLTYGRGESFPVGRLRCVDPALVLWVAEAPSGLAPPGDADPGDADPGDADGSS